MVKLLLAEGAEINFATGAGHFEGYTALHGAARYGHRPVVKLLLEKGADVNALTGRRYVKGRPTPVDLAEDDGIRNLLFEYGGKRRAELEGED